MGEALNLAEPARPEAESGGLLRDPHARLRHIPVCLLHPVEDSKPTGLEAFELTNQALEEVSFGALVLTTSIAGNTQAPLMIALVHVLTELRVFISGAGAPTVRALRGTLKPVGACTE